MGSVKFEKCGRCITVDAVVLDVLNFKFRHIKLLLDTGASTTVMHSDLIISLGYELKNPKPEEVIHTASGTLDYKITELHSLGTIGETISPMIIAAVNLPDVLVENGIVGLLGMDFLSHFETRICYSSDIIEIKK